MDLFRKALQEASNNETCRHGDLVWFRPAGEFVPRQWVEQMAALEWECEESGCCSHPKARSHGCYCGQWVNDQWICDTLLLDQGMVRRPLAQALQNL